MTTMDAVGGAISMKSSTRSRRLDGNSDKQAYSTRPASEGTTTIRPRVRTSMVRRETGLVGISEILESRIIGLWMQTEQPPSQGWLLNDDEEMRAYTANVVFDQVLTKSNEEVPNIDVVDEEVPVHTAEPAAEMLSHSHSSPFIAEFLTDFCRVD